MEMLRPISLSSEIWMCRARRFQTLKSRKSELDEKPGSGNQYHHMKANALFQNLLRFTLVLTLILSATLPKASAATDAKTAFERIKSMAGDWVGPKMMGTTMKANYRVIASGSAVLATFFPNTKNEMISVYYIADGKLVMTHYCMLGNQPRMKLNTKKSSDDTLVFEFAGGDNIKSTKMNMHGETLRFLSKNKVESTCEGQEKGKPKTTHSSIMVRKR